MSGVHRIDILRTFFITTARDLAPELKVEGDNKGDKLFVEYFLNGNFIFFYLLLDEHLNEGSKILILSPSYKSFVLDILEGTVSETYWCSEYHKCHAQRSGNYLCCALYAPTVPNHTMRYVPYILIHINMYCNNGSGVVVRVLA